MLNLKNIKKTYRTSTIETTALNGIELEVKAGEFVAVMGPSGCGKSTLLNIIGMLDSPSSGDYYFNGENVAGYSEAKLAETRKENIGFIFQNFNLIDELSVRENIELGLLYHKNVTSAERRARCQEVMVKMGIEHRADHRPSQLSGGQQQRVAVARALVVRPKLILADEPTGNLDSAHGHEVMKMLQNLNAEGTSVLMVTHDQNHADFAHRTVYLLDGRIANAALRAAE